ncbi:MAG: ABC transporter permease, partial [Steroidobacteraceae bacterium]
MRALRFALLALARDWRSGELAVLALALVIAIAALTGVGFFTDRVGQAVERQAAEVIAADLKLQASRAPSDDWLAAAAEAGLATARPLSFPSVVF